MTTERKPELRFYTFVNFYLSQIQQGIQTGHAAVDLVRKYHDPDSDIQIFSDAHYDKIEMVETWADKWKTFIILNGGDDATISNTFEILKRSDLPFVEFIESTEALNSLRTCVGAVIPDYIFNAKFDQYETRKRADVDSSLAKLGTQLEYPIGSPVYVFKYLDDKDVQQQITYVAGDKYYELITLLRNSRLA